MSKTKHTHTIGYYEGVRLSLSLSQIHDIHGVNLLLKEVDYYSPATTNVNSVEIFRQHVREATACVHKAIDLLSPSIGEDSGDQPAFYCLKLIQCQLENVLKAKNIKRYNLETLVLSLKYQLISPVCYAILRLLILTTSFYS